MIYVMRPSWLLYGQKGNSHPIQHASVGYKFSIRPVTSAHCIVLATIMQRGRCKAIFPKATIAKCRVHLFNVDPNNDPFSSSQVHLAEKLLGLKRKAASTMADFAFLPWNMALHEYYWTHPPPLGMRGVPIVDIIEIEEAGFFLEHSDRKFGKTISSLCCSQNGVYGHGEKVNLLLVICGDNVGQMRWHEQWMEGGTTIERFYDFIDHIIDDLDQNHPGRLCVFTMDNLSAHQNHLVMNRILMGGHRCVSCPLLACRWSR